MRIEHITITCDVDGCDNVFECGKGNPDHGWVLTVDGQDYCPRHAPIGFECSRCGGNFATLEDFDSHLKTCKRKERGL